MASEDQHEMRAKRKKIVCDINAEEDEEMGNMYAQFLMPY